MSLEREVERRRRRRLKGSRLQDLDPAPPSEQDLAALVLAYDLRTRARTSSQAIMLARLRLRASSPSVSQPSASRSSA